MSRNRPPARHRLLTTALAVGLAVVPALAEACTGIRIVAGDDAVIRARTMEFGVDTKSNVILVPRAVGKASLARWLVAARMAAIVSGAYVLSSNRSGVDTNGQRFGGRGWIVDPEGELLAQTSETTPVVSVEIDLDIAARAKSQYPCYVRDS